MYRVVTSGIPCMLHLGGEEIGSSPEKMTCGGVDCITVPFATNEWTLGQFNGFTR